MSRLRHTFLAALHSLVPCLALAALLVACGGDGDGAPVPPPPSEGQATVSTEGGVVAGPDGVTLTIPADAVSEGTTFRIARSANGAPELLGITPLSPLYEITPHGTQFAGSTLLKLPFDATKLPSGATAVVLRGEPDGKWHVQKLRSAGDGVALIDVNELSWYAIGVCTPAANGIFGLGDCPGSHELKLEYLDGNGTLIPVPRNPATGLALSFLPDITVPTDVALRVTWTRPAGVDRVDVVQLRTPGLSYFADESNQQAYTRNVTVHLDPTQTPLAAGPAGVTRRFTAIAEYCWSGFIVGRGPNQSVCWAFDTDIVFRLRDTRALQGNPVITTQPLDRDVANGDPAAFTVAATASEQLMVNWQRFDPVTSTWASAGNAAVFPSGGSVTGYVPASGAQPGSSTFTVTAANAARDQQARLRAQVCNSRVTGSAVCVLSNEAVLGVQTNLSAPSFTRQPASGSVLTGQTFDVIVTANAAPAPTIEIHSSTGGVVKTCQGPGRAALSTTCSFTTTPLALSDSGAQFWAVASMDAAHRYDASSQRATVTVADTAVAPVIDAAEPADVAVDEGGAATFAVNATGTAPLSYQWNRDGVDIVGANASSYTLSHAQLSDSGAHFAVSVVNGTGSATSRAAVLTVRAVAPPVGSTATAVAGDAASFGVYADGIGSAAKFYNPRDLVVDSAGNVYVTDFDTLRKVSPAGVVSTLAGVHGSPGTADGTGSGARFTGLVGMAVESSGNLLVTDGHAIRRVTPGGAVTTVAGSVTTAGTDDGVGTLARFNTPQALSTDPAGNIYVVDYGRYGLNGNFTQGGSVRKIAADGVVSTLTAGFNQLNNPQGIAWVPGGLLVIADTYNSRVVTLPSSGGTPAPLAGTAGVFGYVDGLGAAAAFRYTRGITVDAAGVAYVPDENGQIRRVTAAGKVSSYFAISAAKVVAVPGPAGAVRLVVLANANGSAPALITIIDP